ncbi:hypothetical protein B0H11DRAFT_2031847 [Mycena galericulata]|nr:hypothetical protein B0H11DRAFT_2031847 [Mycena galericulata]
MKGLAAIDLIIVGIENGVTIFDSTYLGFHESILFLFLAIPLLLALTMSGIFRIATILKSKPPICAQRFEFLGFCTRARPPYTPLAILLNRSITRPLFRGESFVIIVTRAIILSFITLGVPAFALYSIIVNPLSSEIYTTSIVWASQNPYVSTPGNATVFLKLFFEEPLTSEDGLKVTANSIVDCPLTFGAPSPYRYAFAQCPHDWSAIIDVQISITIPSSTPGVYVCLGQGDFSPDDDFVEATPLLAGSNLFGLVTWRQRRTGPNSLGISTSWQKVLLTGIVNGLQPYPSSEPSGSRIANLNLFSRFYQPTEVLADTLGVSPLSGISTFGGFWTFVNGRRPLSALGAIHIFQRRALIRQWHVDFPALHTEGSRPGSNSAGIVAFIRERLVDVGDDESNDEDGHPNDEETDMMPSTDSRGLTRSIPQLAGYLRSAGYIMDEHPFPDTETGLTEIGNRGESNLAGQT